MQWEALPKRLIVPNEVEAKQEELVRQDEGGEAAEDGIREGHPAKRTAGEDEGGGEEPEERQHDNVRGPEHRADHGLAGSNVEPLQTHRRRSCPLPGGCARRGGGM